MFGAQCLGFRVLSHSVGEIFNLVSVSDMNQRRVEGHISMTFRQSSRVGTG